MLETILINTNFVLLLLTTLFYWLMALNLLPLQFQFLGKWAVLVSQFLQVSFLSFRWFTSGHFPLSNLYESLLFLSWALTVLLVALNKTDLQSWLFNQRNQVEKTPFNLNSENLSTSLIGSIIMPIILLVNTFALFSLPIELKLTTALVPALQSNWLVMHVTVMILSYGALIGGCLFSMAYLVLTFFSQTTEPFATEGASLTQLNSSQQKNGRLTINEIKTQDSSLQKSQQTQFIILANLLDNLSYRILGLGFPLLTIGLLSGAIWANQTWGSYWSWDPKETWALITWFIFAIYLHTRFSKGWSGQKSALLATFGFFILWICYLGVNLMGKGLHSYGFLS